MTASPLSISVRDQLVAMAASTDLANPDQLNSALRLLAKWRSVLIQNTVLQQHGTTVLSGAMAGLEFLPRSAEGCHVAKLLGCYEQPLQPYLEAAVRERYCTILNIGCAEGYYAVGMARRMPGTQVIACDSNAAAQTTCRALAEKNGVTDRVRIGGHFEHANFAEFADCRTLVLCDIEGGEGELLDPSAAPALRRMDLIVESHECLRGGITDLLCSRFESTHEITVIHDDGLRSVASLPPWFSSLAHLDQLLATWEWRSGATPWLVMKAHDPVC